MTTALILIFKIVIYNIFIPTLLVKIIRNYMRSFYKTCDPNVSMVRKVVIVTGANSGIGFETAKGLAARGSRVILACRNEKRGQAARDEIISQTGNPNVVFRKVDLSSLGSVREFAKNILETEERLDVLVNNAGVYGLGNRCTDDKIVEGMQINYFGPFLLTNLLLPLLRRSSPSRIVNVNSILHFLGEVKVNLLNKKNCYSDFRTYANSKLCNLLFTAELSRRLAGSGVVANSVHPGIIMTNIGNKVGLTFRMLWATWCWLCCKTAAEGAQPVIYLSTAAECGNVSGGYFVDFSEARTLGVAKDSKVARDLWELSEKIVGCKFVNNKYI